MEFSYQHPHIRQFTACNSSPRESHTPCLLSTGSWLPWAHTPTHRHICIHITIVSSYYKMFPWFVCLFVRMLSYLICNTRISLVVVWAHSSSIETIELEGYEFSILLFSSLVLSTGFLLLLLIFIYLFIYCLRVGISIFFAFLSFKEFLYMCVLSQNSFGEHHWINCMTTSTT